MGTETNGSLENITPDYSEEQINKLINGGWNKCGGRIKFHELTIGGGGVIIR